jgi:hypothetical protein
VKRVGELMKDLGFREEASEETAKAFIENLVRAATGEKWTSSKQFSRKREVETPREEEQLSFNLGDVTAKATRKSS